MPKSEFEPTTEADIKPGVYYSPPLDLLKVARRIKHVSPSPNLEGEARYRDMSVQILG